MESGESDREERYKGYAALARISTDHAGRSVEALLCDVKQLADVNSALTAENNALRVQLRGRDMPRVNWNTATGQELVDAFAWHLQRGTGGQVLFGNEIVRRIDALRATAEWAVEWFARNGVEPEDTTIMHGLQEALGQTVAHDSRSCNCLDKLRP